MSYCFDLERIFSVYGTVCEWGRWQRDRKHPTRVRVQNKSNIRMRCCAFYFALLFVEISCLLVDRYWSTLLLTGSSIFVPCIFTCADGSLSTENENAQLLSLARFSLLRHVESSKLSVTLFCLSRVSLVAFSSSHRGCATCSTSLQLRECCSAAERSVPRFRDPSHCRAPRGAPSSVDRRGCRFVLQRCCGSIRACGSLCTATALHKLCSRGLLWHELLRPDIPYLCHCLTALYISSSTRKPLPQPNHLNKDYVPGTSIARVAMCRYRILDSMLA